MTVKELIELLQTYVIADSKYADAQVTNESEFSFDSVETDIDENGDRIVVIY